MKEETKTQEVLDFLDAVEGQGFENMEQDQIAIPRLNISQALSEVVQNGHMEQGHFYNSLTGKDYGTTIQLVVCCFQKVWVEWKKNQGGYVGTYPIGGLEGVTGDNFKKMEHKDADGNINDVIETWNYLVFLPEHLDDGLMVFSSTRGNLKYLKSWNTQMRYLRTPTGRPAPLFSSIWEVSTGKDTNKAGNKYFSCNKDGKSSFVWKGWVSKDMFTTFISPARETAEQTLALVDNSQDIQQIESSESSEPIETAEGF